MVKNSMIEIVQAVMERKAKSLWQKNHPLTLGVRKTLLMKSKAIKIKVFKGNLALSKTKLPLATPKKIWKMSELMLKA